MENILVALDFEPKAQYLIEMAALLAKKFDSKVWILHIASPNPDFVGYEIGPQYIRNDRAHDLRAEHKLLQGFAQKLESKGIEAESLLIQGPTVKMILDEAQKLDIDLIVIGSHEHSLLYKAFHDTTSQNVIKKSKIPLLVVPID